jgi:hypothetical protein
LEGARTGAKLRLGVAPGRIGIEGFHDLVADNISAVGHSAWNDRAGAWAALESLFPNGKTDSPAKHDGDLLFHMAMVREDGARLVNIADHRLPITVNDLTL